MAIEIVNFPIKKSVIFQSYVIVYQRVSRGEMPIFCSQESNTSIPATELVGLRENYRKLP